MSRTKRRWKVDKKGEDPEKVNGEKVKVSQKSHKDHKKLDLDESEKAISKESRKIRKKKKALEKALKKDSENDPTSDVEINSGSKLESLDKGLRSEEAAERPQSKPSNPSKEKEVQDGNAQENNLTSFATSSKEYIQNTELSAESQDNIDAYLADTFITITDSISTNLSLRPITKFSYLPITDPALLAHLKNFETPTPIQAASWPYLFSGRDLIGIAETGSGKTMAFALPCVRSMQVKSKIKGVRALIISPTRELAMQSYEQINQLCEASGIKAACVYGGVPKDAQRQALKTANIVVATPGRLNDLINEGCINLSKAKYLVLDEADRMLDKGFEEEIKKIIDTTPEVGKRQTIMFTATWPSSVQSLASTFMKTPVKILIGENKTGDLRANNRITQKVEVIEPTNKEYRLLEILKKYQSDTKKDDRIIVFALYKKEATRIERFIKSKGFRVAAIHGDLSQEQRTRSLEAFKKGNTPILVATDVAARGLDIPSVKLVLNLTFPLTVEDYVHRIGRTGRAGKEGLAITLFTEHDKSQAGALINVLKAAKQDVPEELFKFGTTVKRKEHEAYGAFAKNVDMTKKAKKIKFD